MCDVLKSEPGIVQGSLQPRRAVGAEDGVARVMFFDGVAEKQLRGRRRSRLKQSVIKATVRVRIDSSVRPERWSFIRIVVPLTAT